MDKKKVLEKFSILIVATIQESSKAAKLKVGEGFIIRMETTTMGSGKMISLMESDNTTQQREVSTKVTGNKKRGMVKADKLGLMVPFFKEFTSSIKRPVENSITTMARVTLVV